MKSLLVHLDGTPRCAQRLRIAGGLARRLGMRLAAVFATAPPLLGTGYGYTADAVPLDVLGQISERWRERARQCLDAAPEARGAARVEVGVESGVVGFVRQAVYADLLVLGQHDAADRDPQLPADFVETVLAASGRPAIVVPHAGSFEVPGRRVLVAWQPAPGPARALSAALPLLRGAERVTVVEWGHEPDDCRGDALDVGAYCRLHGVEAEVHRHADEPGHLGEALLSHAADLDADLLVMGCYGHSRARERLLGGVSRTVLASMTLPVLLSH